MFMGIILSQLCDIENATAYYDKAVEMDPNNATLYLNYSISLINHDLVASATEKFQSYKELRNTSQEDEETKEAFKKLEELLS